MSCSVEFSRLTKLHVPFRYLFFPVPALRLLSLAINCSRFRSFSHFLLSCTICGSFPAHGHFLLTIFQYSNFPIFRPMLRFHVTPFAVIIAGVALQPGESISSRGATAISGALLRESVGNDTRRLSTHAAPQRGHRLSSTPGK